MFLFLKLKILAHDLKKVRHPWHKLIIIIVCSDLGNRLAIRLTECSLLLGTCGKHCSYSMSGRSAIIESRPINPVINFPDSREYTFPHMQFNVNLQISICISIFVLGHKASNVRLTTKNCRPIPLVNFTGTELSLSGSARGLFLLCSSDASFFRLDVFYVAATLTPPSVNTLWSSTVARYLLDACSERTSNAPQVWLRDGVSNWTVAKVAGVVAFTTVEIRPDCSYTKCHLIDLRPARQI